ncbi:putative calpain-like cysteine peptidase [Leptomonas pyrrhocoris]|uniref:Putative calpain-like cysteine peptidase n=1 Tax=Leptomonas pyrrhocoris TaxID=157538 RepID=A0A0N0VEK2_LEPPY|nr:putative calpain-like cysteine peptidase [Leptomonas pyrrhocoris]KPA78594.1 putative calpain-like cysteine peptidase [Leptomonas pyrrhocoris]|eukprot:XP_015657033.1 putative calpain-like cysteine peptidase [Leptomonas pyrrhocoris]
MSCTALNKYLEICTSLNEHPLHQFEELLQSGAQKIDVSRIYLPRKHFRCLFQFIEERPDVEELVLDGASLTTEDVKSLKECLLHSCVSKLSLRQNKLDAACATALRQLCMSNPGIVEINLDDTCIPSPKIDEIQLIVNLNRLNADSLRSSNVVSVRNESSRVNRWQLCQERCRFGSTSQLQFKSHSARSVIDEFVKSCKSLFCDSSFTVENFNHPLANIETIRWSSYCEISDCQSDLQNQEELGFSESDFYNNTYLCAGFNALRFYDALTKPLLLRGFQQAGLYVFRLFIDGAVAEVIVDDTLPCLKSEDSCFLVGVSSCCYPFYGALLEKAIAKAIGGYKYLEELSFCDYIEMLTGGTSFEINLTMRAFNSSVTFELLRTLSENGQKLVACLIPRSQREAQACESDGISCNLPYTVLKADVCRKNGLHYAYLLQIATPFPKKPVKNAFEDDTFKSTQINGRLVVWMTLEDFAVVFGQVYLIMWAYEDAASEHKTTKELSALSAVTTSSTLFANNSAFYIENEGNSESGVMISLRPSRIVDPSNKLKCLFYKYIELGYGTQTRRYDVCDRNALFKSDEFSCNGGSVFFNLLPREKLQLVIGSQIKASLTVLFSAVEDVKVTSLPETMLSSRLLGEWNTTVSAKRLSDKIVCLTNGTQECNTYCVVALAQLPSQDPPFPIGAFGWIGDSADVVTISTPHFSTALERSAMSVHSISLPVHPNECLFILPYCCGTKCADKFELTVFSVCGMTRTVFDTADFL